MSVLSLIHQHHYIYDVWHRQAEGQERKMAHIRGHAADDGYRWWQHRGMGRYADLASQDHAQEVPVWDTHNNHHADSLSDVSVYK